MLILVSGLPRSGKTAFADALASLSDYTHVPLDRYIRPVSERVSFLDWVSSPGCINWTLLQEHLDALAEGEERVAPSDWGPSWGVGGQHRRAPGSGHLRLMRPSQSGYAIAGCYAFELPLDSGPSYRVFVSTPRAVIAERAMGRPVLESEVEHVLEQQLSSNWRTIEGYSRAADLVLSGVEPHEGQVETLLQALRPYSAKSEGN